MNETRYALSRTRITDEAEALKRRDVFRRFMPSNYDANAVKLPDGTYGIIIFGEDSAGWGLDTYVLPRLASGLYWAGEVTEAECRELELLPVDRA